MCGIAGYISFQRSPEALFVAELVRQIHHRGPDDYGVWSSPDRECVLGHARLSIIDLSPLGHQPMVDPESGNCIVFNGEIYNFHLLRRECELSGYRFRSHTDTEVILALYRQYGVECLQKLRGMFSFAIWDEQRKSFFFARDRVGKKPLNYAVVDGGLVFCSEIDPLSRHPSVSRDMDNEALELYLQLQYIPAPWTIYRGIRKLPPAHFGLLDQDGLKIERYWDVDYIRKVRISEQDALDVLDEKLTEAVRLRMISDVPLGALLSGGVDSSIVVALMAKLSGEPVRTFSIGFREEAFNELRFAQQVADICGTAHYPEIVEGNVAHLLPLLVKHYGEPYADSSAVPSFFVSRIARRHVTVAMNGDGGDELLGGYPRYCLSPWQLNIASLFHNNSAARFQAALAVYLSTVKSYPLRIIRKLLTKVIWPHIQPVGMHSDGWNDVVRSQLMGYDRASSLLPDWRTTWLAEAMVHADNPVDRMLWYDNRTYLPGDLLVKIDIASMHCGLETRSPLLDHEVIEYCASLPVNLKVNNRVGKYLLKKLAERYFPKDFVHRRKMGFAIPVSDWLRGSLRPLLEDTLRSAEIMAPLNRAVILETLDEFMNHDVNHCSKLWGLLMYGLWRQHSMAVRYDN